jgi:hypothetical protein
MVRRAFYLFRERVLERERERERGGGGAVLDKKI